MVEMYEFIRDFEGEVPGASPEDCGNYLDMNLGMARFLAGSTWMYCTMWTSSRNPGLYIRSRQPFKNDTGTLRETHSRTMFRRGAIKK